MSDIKSMFESIKDSLNKKDNSKASKKWEDYLKIEAGTESPNFYVVRLVPNVKNPRETIYKYAFHGRQSVSTGRYQETACLANFDEKCPVCEAFWKEYNVLKSQLSKEELKKKANQIGLRAKTRTLVNVYVVKDPINPQNEGKIKILNVPSDIATEIEKAVTGVDADEFGHKIFDLSDNGCNLRIEVKSLDGNPKSQFRAYKGSKFTNSSAIPGMSPEKIKQVHDKAFNLSERVDVVSREDLVEWLDKHYYDRDPTQKPVEEVKVDNHKPVVINSNTTAVEKPTDDEKSEQDKINELLADIDNIKM